MDQPFANLDLLPYEMIFQILLKTDDLQTIINYCQTSQRAASVCRDEDFWKSKYQLDFRDLPILAGNDTWRKRYKRIFLSRRINSPLSGKSTHYGIIDQAGKVYIAGEKIIEVSGRERPETSISIQSFNNQRPVNIPFSSKVISVSAGVRSTGAVTEDGEAYFWGLNGVKYKLLDWKDSVIETPEQLKLPLRAIKICLGRLTFAILSEEGFVYFKGVFKLKDGPTVISRAFFRKRKDIRIIDIAAGDMSFAAVDSEGRVYFWGVVFWRKIKLNKNKQAITERKHIEGYTIIPFPEPIKQVSLGARHLMALSRSGQVYVLGRNSHGALGLGPEWLGKRIKRPRKLSFPEPISYISSSLISSSAITISQKLYIWGSDPLHQTFKGKEIIPSPTQIDIGLPVENIALGFNFTLALSNDGVVNRWGFFPFG